MPGQSPSTLCVRELGGEADDMTASVRPDLAERGTRGQESEEDRRGVAPLSTRTGPGTLTDFSFNSHGKL